MTPTSDLVERLRTYDACIHHAVRNEAATRLESLSQENAELETDKFILQCRQQSLMTELDELQSQLAAERERVNSLESEITELTSGESI